MILGPVHCPHMVGRRAQLEFLLERAKAAAQGRGSLVFVEGDSGAGKTRLVSEWFAADPQRLRHLDGRCYQYARAPFGPIVAAGRTLFKEDAELVPADRAARVILSRLIPELGDAPPVALPLDPSEKLHHFEVLAEVLRNAAGKKPTLFVIEDLHWADEATTEFLEHFANAMSSVGLCIAATYRADELPQGHRLRALVARLERNRACWRIGIERLSDEEMQRFITEALGLSAIAPELALVIARRSEGSPLFAEELLRSAIGDAGGRHGAAALPASVREAVLARLAQLSDADQAIVKTAAAIGRRFSAELLATIAQRPLASVIPALKRAIDLQLIEQGDDGTLEFRHELTREATASELLDAEARPLHATIARTLEALPDADRRTEELAYQWWAAGDAGKAASYNERAGDAAEAVVASKDAAIHFERALEAMRSDDPRRAIVLRKLGAALYRSGLGARAKTAYDAAIAAFVATGDEEEAARTLVDLARLRWTLGEIPGHRSATQQAIEMIGDRTASAAWFAARVEMAWTTACQAGRPQEAQDLLAQAAPFEAAAPIKDRIKFHECRSLVRTLRAQSDDALADAREAAELALGAGDVATSVRCYGNIGLLSAQCGARPIAEEAFSQAIALIDAEHPFGWPAPWTLALYACAQVLWGLLPEAELTIDRALGAILDVPSLDAIVACVALPLGLRRRNDAMVQRCADEDLIEFAFNSKSTLIGVVASPFAEYYIAKDRVTEAAALLERAIDTLEAPPPAGDWDAALVMGAEIADREHAQRACAILHDMSTAGAIPTALAHEALADAWREQRFGDATAARHRASLTAEAFEALGWPAHQARALELSGQLQAAADIYARIGDVRNAQRLAEVISPVNRRGRRKYELSAREQEIVELVIAGKTNKEIAAQLVLSERTVESHVGSIFAKLAIGSRRELAERLKASRS